MTDQLSLFDASPPKIDTKVPEIPTKQAEIVTEPPKIETPYEWAMRRWIEFTTPAWRKVLNESIEQGDKDREKYARWILKDVLGVEDV